MRETGIEAEKVVGHFLTKGIKINPPENGIMRFVTNYWVNREDISYVVDTMKEISGYDHQPSPGDVWKGQRHPYSE
jgi:threonine aldolase